MKAWYRLWKHTCSVGSEDFKGNIPPNIKMKIIYLTLCVLLQSYKIHFLLWYMKDIFNTFTMNGNLKYSEVSSDSCVLNFKKFKLGFTEKLLLH